MKFGEDMTSGRHHHEMGFPDPLRTHDAHHGLTTTHTRMGDTHAGRFSHREHAEQMSSLNDAHHRRIPSPHGRPDSTIGGIDGSGAQHSVGATRAISGMGGRSAIGTLVMVYGSAEVCSRTQCGLTFMPHKAPHSFQQQQRSVLVVTC